MQALLDAVGNRSVQIHSSKRTDREQMTRIWTQAHRVSIPHFEAVMRPRGAEGCFLSHQAVAAWLAGPYLVLEDDALPTLALHDTQHVFHVIQAMASRQFDVLYLGGLPAASRVKATDFPGVLEGRCGATFAMVVSPRAAQFLRNGSYNNVAVDVQLVRAKQLRTAFVHPPLFVMAETRSDIGKNSFNKSETFARVLSSVAPVWRSMVVWQNEWLVAVAVLVLVLLCVRLRRPQANG
jgi:hypothetical protein